MSQAGLFILRFLDVEQEVDDVAVLHDVVLALAADQTLCLGGSHGAAGLHILKGNDLGADEPPLKVGVDLAGGLGGLGALFDGPGPALVGARGQEGNEAQQSVLLRISRSRPDSLTPSSSMNMAFSSGSSSSAMSASSLAQMGMIWLPSASASCFTAR